MAIGMMAQMISAAAAGGDRAAARQAGREGARMVMTWGMCMRSGNDKLLAVLEWAARERRSNYNFAESLVSQCHPLMAEWCERTQATSLAHDCYLQHDTTMLNYHETRGHALPIMDRYSTKAARRVASLVASSPDRCWAIKRMVTQDNVRMLALLAPTAVEVASVLQIAVEAGSLGVLEWLEGHVSAEQVGGVATHKPRSDVGEEQWLATLGWLSEHGWTPRADCVLEAARRGWVAVLDLLAKWGLRPEGQVFGPLPWGGNPAVARWLISRGVPSASVRQSVWRNTQFHFMPQLEWLVAESPPEEFAANFEASAASLLRTAVVMRASVEPLECLERVAPEATRRACQKAFLTAATAGSTAKVLDWLAARACPSDEQLQELLCRADFRVAEWLCGRLQSASTLAKLASKVVRNKESLCRLVRATERAGIPRANLVAALRGCGSLAALDWLADVGAINAGNAPVHSSLDQAVLLEWRYERGWLGPSEVAEMLPRLLAVNATKTIDWLRVQGLCTAADLEAARGQ